MISWCSYCQTYQGEVPPFDRFDLTHGICKACTEKKAMADGDAVARIQPIVDFHARLREKARDGFATAPRDVFDQAVALGIQPLDLLIGLVQPALYEIGDLWTRGEVTVANEHRFSAMVDSLTALVLERMPRGRGLRRSAEPDVLLANADGNYHTLGVRMVELLLVAHGLTTVAVVPGVPAGETLELARSLRPRTFGVSVSLGRQMKAVREIGAGLAGWPAKERPRLVVGGLPIKAGLRLDPALGAEAIADPRALLVAPGQANGTARA
ncbi:MAG: hypothetical protein B7Z68_10900 [Acidobacteria bacterium 21-70-11]|nr:MAG: hypothetical protein B7Z68_10900 [Acidobacteria bacterium 21-70-11]HQU34254.1 B12-binding domain-containing protein [Thermoanaerobaculaceae bacterium]